MMMDFVLLTMVIGDLERRVIIGDDELVFNNSIVTKQDPGPFKSRVVVFIKGSTEPLRRMYIGPGSILNVL